MDIKTIKRYKKYSTPKLIEICQTHFNRYIRERDNKKEFGCISCNSPSFTDAGHYIAVGSCSALRFHELNANGQCKACNYFKHGNPIEYRRRLISRYGRKEVEELEELQLIYKQQRNFKWDRVVLIEKIEYYKNKRA